MDDVQNGDPLTQVNDEIGKNYQRGVTMALRFDPIEHWLIKTEYQRNAGTLNISSVDNPNGQSLYWNLFAVKTTFDF